MEPLLLMHGQNYQDLHQVPLYLLVLRQHDINALVGGVYQFQLTVTDNSGASSTDTVQVTVNQAPVANAGADILVNLPINTVTIIGSGTDADGTIATYAWVKLSGPAPGTIVSPNTATTDINAACRWSLPVPVNSY